MLEAKRITDIVGRQGTILSNGDIRLVVEDFAGMTPEFSFKTQNGYTNTHLVPHFRGSSCAFDEKKHQSWGIKLAHELAGNFPCFPNFGFPSEKRGYTVPPCGHTANMDWAVTDFGTTQNYAYQVATMGGEKTANVHYKKYDILLKGHNVHYQVIKIRNEREEVFNFGGAWHNTTGQPFIEKGCRIAASADKYHTPPVTHDPEQIERLKLNSTFDSLKSAPLNEGGTADISIVPGMIGYTDFLTGRIPQNAPLGWMGIVNPNQNALYLTFFKGADNLPEDEFTFHFNHIWLQYGGRNYLPWSKYDGGVDQTFAVGIESAISAWGYGLDYCDENPELMGNPTILPLNPGEEKIMYHGTLIGPIGAGSLDEGISTVLPDEKGLKILGENDQKGLILPADSSFTTIKEIVAEIDKN